jgi:hypothetical protein
MSALKAIYVYGYFCDQPHCEATVEGERRTFWEGLQTYWAHAEALGWTKWAGRSQRTYCPKHGPGKNTKMHQVRS